jgi:hypothetical protein
MRTGRHTFNLREAQSVHPTCEFGEANQDRLECRRSRYDQVVHAVRSFFRSQMALQWRKQPSERSTLRVTVDESPTIAISFPSQFSGKTMPKTWSRTRQLYHLLVKDNGFYLE